MDMEQLLQNAMDAIVPLGLNILGALAILILGRIIAGVASRMVKRAMDRAKVDQTVTLFVSRMASVVVIVFAVVAALAKFGIQTTSFVAILGAAGFAIGMALQGSLGNFASGIMIIMFRPFGVGHTIEAGGIIGTVEEIRLFTTVLKTPDGIQVTVPNGRIFGDTIKNFSANATRRIDVLVGIAYDAGIGEAVEAAKAVMKEDDRVLSDPEPQVFVTDLGDSSVNLSVRCWVKGSDFWQTKCDLTQKIKERFDNKDIEIPFPQRVVHHVGGSAVQGG